MEQLITIAGFVLQLIAILVGVTWQISSLRVEIRDQIAKERKNLDDKMELQNRNLGEVAAALREKITQFELFARDTFVRRDSVDKLTERLENRLQSMAEKVDDIRDEQRNHK